MTWLEWQRACFPDAAKDVEICPEFALAPKDRVCNQPLVAGGCDVCREQEIPKWLEAALRYDGCDACRAQQVPEWLAKAAKEAKE